MSCGNIDADFFNGKLWKILGVKAVLTFHFTHCKSDNSPPFPIFSCFSTGKIGEKSSDIFMHFQCKNAGVRMHFIHCKKMKYFIRSFFFKYSSIFPSFSIRKTEKESPQNEKALLFFLPGWPITSLGPFSVLTLSYGIMGDAVCCWGKPWNITFTKLLCIDAILNQFLNIDFTEK